MDKVINLEKMDLHYWINELPKLEMNNVCEKVINIKGINKVLDDTLQVALELSLHKHISSYAMLGFDYVPVKSFDSLIVRINYYEENDINYLSQIRPNESCKYIHTGIDKFLSEVVAEKIIETSEKNSLPAGNLNFKVAANCEISSSPFIFGIITKILLDILRTIDKAKSSDKNYFDKLFIEAVLNSGMFT